ncbi:MAG: hypothetical protein H6600_06105 [Flavobacteriales bacterium]|nr:hypothetical protein [Flavobacteriales bacterium]MCB9198016.1 hypothetical protein [Flavobacteriales bacterium]
MNRINLNNYEAFWLDYLEDNLSDEDREGFVLFANQHPDLEIDLSDELIHLKGDSSINLSSAEKDNLKEVAELETLVILLQDGELDDQIRLLELKTKYPDDFTILLALYQKTKLLPSPEFYPNKQQLKQPVIISMYSRFAVAAAVIGLIALFYPWNNNSIETNISGQTLATTFDFLQPLSSSNKVAMKQFDFYTKEETNEENDHVLENYLADETPELKDSSVEKQPEIWQEEDLQVAIDTTSNASNIVEDIVQQKDTNSTNPIIDLEEDENLVVYPTSKNLTVPEFLAEKVLKVERNQEEPLIASIIDQKTNWEVDYDETESSNKKITQFKVGKFKFYKSTSK